MKDPDHIESKDRRYFLKSMMGLGAVGLWYLVNGCFPYIKNPLMIL